MNLEFLEFKAVLHFVDTPIRFSGPRFLDFSGPESGQIIYKIFSEFVMIWFLMHTEYQNHLRTYQGFMFTTP